MGEFRQMGKRLLSAMKVGIIAGMFFEVAFVASVFIWPDPQGGIALLFSPFYAAWVATSVGLIAVGHQWLRDPIKGDKLPRIGLVIVGLAGLILFAIYMGSEIYQATHPRRANDASQRELTLSPERL